MPLHLRWELYPVAHEPNSYGGSYMEKLDWWRIDRKTTTLGMLKELLVEMLFIKRLFIHKRKLWYVSFPFHAGIYLILAWFGLLVASGVAILYAGIPIPSGQPLAQLLFYLTLVLGGAGMIATTVGGIGVAVERINDREMREYTTPSDYFNLTFVIAAALLGLVSWVLYDPTFGTARQFMTALISFGVFESPKLYPLTQSQIIVVGLLFVYTPFTKMSHFVGKYFTYHTILWDDAPNVRGNMIEKKVKQNLGYRISWSAPHLKAGRSWAEEATQPSSPETKKTGDKHER
jgi:nitrate reductase gamma subunit